MTASDLLKPYDGLRVLVTGGASGIGLEIADTFADCGARVHVCDASQAVIAALADRPSRTAISATLADVADPAAVERVFADVAAMLGGLDVPVNNAGIAGPTGGIDEIDPAQWEQTVAINLNARFQFARRAVPLLRNTQHGGAIIALSSVAGRLGYAFRTPYAATKWAVVGLVKSLAIELGPLGIRVNAIQPGIVRGPRMRRVIEARAQQLGTGYDEMEKRYLEKISLRRMTDPAEIAATALFLCSPGGHGRSPSAATSKCSDASCIAHRKESIRGKRSQSHHHLRADRRDPHTVDVAVPARDGASDRDSRRRGCSGRCRDPAPARAQPVGRQANAGSGSVRRILATYQGADGRGDQSHVGRQPAHDRPSTMHAASRPAALTPDT